MSDSPTMADPVTIPHNWENDAIPASVTDDTAEIVAFCATCGHPYAAGDALHAHTEEN